MGSGNSTTLTAAAADPQSYPLTYHWSLASGPSGANVSFANQNSTTATASGLTVAGQYVFDVAVSDGHGDTSTEQVGFNVFSGPQSPIVQVTQSRAPSGQSQPLLLTLPQSSVMLLSQLYYDLQGKPAIYNWSVVSEPSGAAASLATSTSQSCNANNLTVAGDYKFQVVVSDGVSTPVTQYVTVSVDPANLRRRRSPMPPGLTSALAWDASKARPAAPPATTSPVGGTCLLSLPVPRSRLAMRRRQRPIFASTRRELTPSNCPRWIARSMPSRAQSR